MKNMEELLSRFNDIQDIPVSEEILGAYIEGTASEAETSMIEHNLAMESFMNEVILNEDTPDAPQLGSVFEEDFGFSLPQIETNNSFMMEEISIPKSLIIYEAQKHYGLEPLNIEFDPNTYQWEDDTCAIRSQEIVLRSFGTFVSQEDLINQAEVHGWYSQGGGTPIEAVGNLLDLYNVPNHRLTNANVFNLADELGQGHQVIVGVDINELYENSFWQSIKEHLVGKTPNHAMIVSGLDTSDPDCTKVILTDPGTGKTLFECPYDKFLSAWNDSNCFMVATDDAAPLQYNPTTMMNFDYNKGHVSFLGSIPFDDFHDHVVPDVNNYLDSVDEYINALEKTMANGFNLDDFNDMVHKADIAHNNAIELHMHNVEQKGLGTVSFGSISEDDFINDEPEPELSDDDSDDSNDDDFDMGGNI